MTAGAPQVQEAQADTRTYHFVCARADLQRGVPAGFEVKGRSLFLLDLGDEVVCLRNRCPHMGAPLDKGALGGTCLPHGVHTYILEREGEVLRCPWHAWEFDVRTGRTIHDPAAPGTKKFDVQIRDEEVWVTFSARR